MNRHEHREMQYALMSGGAFGEEHKFLLIDANEYSLIDEIFTSEDIKRFAESKDADKINYSETLPYKIVYGLIRRNPFFDEELDISDSKNKLHTAYLEDGIFHDFGVYDIKQIEFPDKDNIPIAALIQSEFNIPNIEGRAVTGFISYADLSSIDSMLNRRAILSLITQEECTVNSDDLDNWHKQINYNTIYEMMENELHCGRNK